MHSGSVALVDLPIVNVEDLLDYEASSANDTCSRWVLDSLLCMPTTPVGHLHTDFLLVCLSPGSVTPPRPGFMSAVWGRIVQLFTSRDPNPFYSNFRLETPNEAFDPRQMARQAVSATAARRKAPQP